MRHKALCQKLTGHYGYYGVATNSQSIRDFRYHAERIWRYWLNRRSDRRSMPWPRFKQMAKRLPLPQARIRVPIPTREQTRSAKSRMR